MTLKAQPETGSRLHGRWLVIARVAWIVVAALNLGVAALTLYSLAYNLRLGGPGIQYRFEKATQETIIEYIYPGSPAAETGLQAGDKVLAVDGAPFDPDLFWEAGAPGSLLTLTVRTRIGEVKQYVLTRRADWYPITIGVLLAGLPLGLYVISLLVLEAVVILAFTSVAAVIFWRRSEDWMGLLFSMTILLLGTTNNIGILVTRFGVPSLPGGWEFLPRLVATQWGLLGTILIFQFILLFPDGRHVPRWSWPLGIAQAALQVENRFSRILPVPIGFLALGCCGLSALAFQAYRYARVSTPIQRQQTKWVVVGLAIWGISYGSFLTFGVFGAPALRLPWLVWAQVFSLDAILSSLGRLALSLCLGLAILRYRLWDIDLIIRRTLVYGVLTAALVLVYYVSVVLLQALFRALTGQEQSPVVTVISTLAIAALFTPLRRRVQDAIDRRFYRKKYDAAKTLATFSETVRDETDLDKLTERLVAVVDETMQPAHVSLWLRKQAMAQGPTEHAPRRT